MTTKTSDLGTTIYRDDYRIVVSAAITNPDRRIITITHVPTLTNVGFAPSLDAAKQLCDWHANRGVGHANNLATTHKASDIIAARSRFAGSF